MQKEKFGTMFYNGRMIDIDEASLLELKNISDSLKTQKIEAEKRLENILKK